MCGPLLNFLWVEVVSREVHAACSQASRSLLEMLIVCRLIFIIGFIMNRLFEGCENNIF